MHLSRPRLARLAALVAALGVAGHAAAAEHYYCLVFGSQSHPKQLRYTHTWATFVRVVDDGSGSLATAPAEQHTISWLPASLQVRVWAATPEPGVNLDLDTTLRFVASNGEHVTCWGPFEIGPEIYQRSLQVRAVLDSGAARYRAISGPDNLLVSDCIHAVAAIDPVFGRDHYPLIRIGKPASRYIARQVMTRSPVDQHQIHAEWLIPRLGLDRDDITILPPQQIPRRNCVLCRGPD